MMKKFAHLVALAIVAVALAGCVPTSNKSWNETAERQRLTSAVNAWATGVEEYDIDAMAGEGTFAAGFRLTIEEGGASHTKDAALLRSELESDSLNQQLFRSESGYGIRLDIDGPWSLAGDAWNEEDPVNNWTIVSINRSKAKVTGFFEVFEVCDGMPEKWRSDSGLIEIELVRIPAGWKMTAMTIRFGKSHYGAAVREIPSSLASAVREVIGFGFCKLVP
ncbi:MAG: hypothetical protein PHP20_04745 [Firmicutes bacterium]|nr:hypothetical protein [Bacillota bacterium]MDD4792351.1 hypothetical protein [Bacillota bacterium]